MISIKLFLCVIIIGTGIIVGQLKARSYDNRMSHLQSFISILKVIESEMKYRLDPLPEIFERLSKTKNGLSGELLEKTFQIIKSNPNYDFSSCWNHAAESVYKNTSISAKDLQVICDIGVDLGKTDLSGQSSLFKRAFTLLEAQVAEADEERRAKGKMYKSLGAAIGVLIVIILI